MALKMESMTLDVNVVSARGLNGVDPVSEMKIYVVVSLTGDVQNEQKALTKVDRGGGGNPTWNIMMKFVINGSAATQDLQIYLAFTLRCEHALGDRDVGEVQVPVAELLQSAGDRDSMQFVCYPVKTPSGQTEGVLNFEYKFGGSPLAPPPKLDKPATACATRGVGYPPQGYYPTGCPPKEITHPSLAPPVAGYGGYPPSAQPYDWSTSSAPPYGAYPQPSPSYNTHYMPPPSPQAYAYPPYNFGSPPAPPYVYPPQPGYGQARPPAAEYGQRSVQNPPKKKKSAWGLGAARAMGGMVGALAVGVLSGGSAPSFESILDSSDLTYAPPDISNLVSLPDPNSIVSDATDYRSYI